MKSDTILIAGVGAAAILALIVLQSSETKWGPSDFDPKEYTSAQFNQLVADATQPQWLAATCPGYVAAHARALEDAKASGRTYLEPRAVGKCRNIIANSRI